MLSVIIVDDELAAGKLLEMKLNTFENIQVEAVIQSPYQVMEQIEKIKPDAIFLDIEIPEISGLELAEKISCLEDAPEVIFVTAYSEFALEAFKVNALDYLVKPVSNDELIRVIKKIDKRRGNGTYKLKDFVKENLISAKLLGTFRLYDNTQEINLDFATNKSLELLCYMLLKAKPYVSKWKLIEELWPGKNDQRGEASLRTTVFRTNQALKESGLSLKIKADKSNYFITVRLKLEDLEEIERLDEEKIGIIVKSNNIVQLIDIYPGHLLQDRDFLWCYELSSYYSNLFLHKISNYMKMNEKEISLQMLISLMKLYPDNEGFFIKTLHLTKQEKGIPAVRNFYEKYQALLLKQYGISMGENVEKAYREMLR